MNLPVTLVERTWDVIVAGGGTAGVFAGVSAARAGARVLVTESFGSVGGSGTNAQVTPLMRNVSSGVNLNRGLTDELKRRMNERGDGATDAGGNDNWFNPEGMKYVLERMLLDHGAELLYHTHVVAPVMEGERLTGMVVHNKGGLQEVRASVFIDATGDADLAVAAGVPFLAGDEDGIHQAMSLRFTLAGLDLSRLNAFLGPVGQGSLDPVFIHFWMVWEKGSKLEPLFRQAVEEGTLEERDGDYFQAFSMPGRPGELSFNCPRIRADLNDGADPWHLSAAQIDGREGIERLLRFCRLHLPGCETAYLAAYAPMVGVRESRRIRGDYTLTLDDILECRTFPDAVCRNHYPVDIHTVRNRERLQHTTTGDAPYFRKDAFHEIPYRAMLPVGVSNLLVPGRSASATFEAQSAIRVQQNCHSMGEAAGLAAALAAQGHGGEVRAVDPLALREQLKGLGANL
ncbi:FAD-dependent oxidoreductase (plasmid) [Deinococcus altitudinis]